MKYLKYNPKLIFIIFFLTFCGYEIVQLLFIYVGKMSESRNFTIPLRIFIILNLIFSFWIKRDFRYFNKYHFLFLWFSLVYFIRLLIEFYTDVPYFLSISTVFLYFLSFAFLPFIGISMQKIDKAEVNAIYYSILFSGLLFSVLTTVFYGKYLGLVERLTSATAGEDMIDPLSFSYVASLTIGVVSSYLLTHRVKKYAKIISILTILISTVPYYLGASRGSIISLFLPFFISFFFIKDLKTKLVIILTTVFSMFFLVYLSNFFGTGLLDRFLRTGEEIRTASDEASRIDIYETSVNQFLEHPFFGDSIRVPNINSYTHNITLEVLQSVGIIGFIPFLILILKSVQISIKLLKFQKQLSWVAIVFFQSFIYFSFSGSVWGASWVWLSIALLLSLDYSIKSKYYNNDDNYPIKQKEKIKSKSQSLKYLTRFH